MDQTEFQVEFLRRLDLVIRLLLEATGTIERPKVSAIIGRLLDYGLSATQVAAIVGKPSNYVTAVNSTRRKAKQRAGAE